MKRACSNCDYFVQPDHLRERGGLWTEFGECRRRMPVIQHHDGALPDRAWPMVRIDDWCGEFEERR